MTDPSAYDFTADWFSSNERTWSALVKNEKPARILEIGSFEGRSACWLIENCGSQRALEIHCIDTWGGGIEHQAGGAMPQSMPDVERRFHHNIKVAKSRVSNPIEIVMHKGYSHPELAKLIAEGKSGYFDLIYIDGSHQAPDVLGDAVLSFPLARTDGVLIFDDYLWYMEPRGQQDSFNMPKPAIDAFVNIYQRKLIVFRDAPIGQLYIRKISD